MPDVLMPALSASPEWKTFVPVLSCLHCRECINNAWYDPKEIYIAGQGMIENPYRGRCRNCGSRQFFVGGISRVEMLKWEKEGWEFIPWFEPSELMETPHPGVKNNIFIMGK